MREDSVNLNVVEDLDFDGKPRFTVSVFLEGQSHHGCSASFGRALLELGAMLHHKNISF